MKLSPLEKMIFLEKDARDFGLYWPDHQMILDQAIDECGEIKEALKEENSAHLQEEIGDLIHAALSLCIFSGYDVHETLERTNQKFEKRMQAVKDIALGQGLITLQGKSTEFMIGLWQQAKKKR